MSYSELMNNIKNNTHPISKITLTSGDNKAIVTMKDSEGATSTAQKTEKEVIIPMMLKKIILNSQTIS